jgi:hypothetical protein
VKSMRDKRVVANGVLLGVVFVFMAAGCGGSSPAKTDGGAGQDAVVSGDGQSSGSDAPLDANQTDDSQVGDGPSAEASATDALVQNDGGDAAVCVPVNTGECDPVCQNCGVGQKCTLTPDNVAVASCLTNQTVAPGGACQYNPWYYTSYDNCSAHSVCLGGPGGYLCRVFCRADSDCAIVNGTCSPNPSPGTTFKVCTAGSTTCDPVANTGCGSDGCFLTGGSGIACLSQGSGVDGTPCPNNDECHGGYTCTSWSGSWVCRPVCRLGTGCGGGHTCVNHFGNSTYGACVPL